jgi:tRNA-binding EMAP/Myf-like protein
MLKTMQEAHCVALVDLPPAKLAGVVSPMQ